MALSGETFVLSGLKMDEYKPLIEKMKGRVTTAISGKTTILLVKHSSDATVKVTKAKELGIKIMTKDEFAKKYLSHSSSASSASSASSVSSASSEKKVYSPISKHEIKKKVTLHLNFDAYASLTKNRSANNLAYKQYTLLKDELHKLLPSKKWIIKQGGIFEGPAEEVNLFLENLRKHEISLVVK